MEERYRYDGLKVVSISLDDSRAAARSLADRVGATFPVIHDPNGEIFALYRVGPIPTNIGIGRDGKVRAAKIGFEGPEALDAFALSLLD